MERFKKIGFFVIFFFTLFEVMGGIAVQKNDRTFLIENQEKEQPGCELNFHDSDQQDDEYSLDSLVPFISVLMIMEDIPLSKYFIDLLFDFNFWQPPQNFLL